MGSNIQSIIWARIIAKIYGATVAQPTYRLAPEHKFPTAPNDIWDSVQWIAANASALDMDLCRVADQWVGILQSSVLIGQSRKNFLRQLLEILASIPVYTSK